MIGDILNVLVALDLMRVLSAYFFMEEQDSIYGWYMSEVDWRFQNY